jgi:hypothetical protein
VIELQNRLEHLDREWEKFREAALVRNQEGKFLEPSRAVQVIMGTLGTLIGVLVIIGFATIEAPMMAIFGFALIGFSIYRTIKGEEKVQSFRDHQNRYFTARTKLLEQLDSERAKL